MAITPQTNVRLLKCPLNINNKHQINFASKTEQTAYFKSLPYTELEECSYIRKDNIIRFPAHIDDIIEYNYVMYQNENYSNKWFYAYITDMKYENDGLTYITIKTDVFQTWQFDIVYKKMFVEREHVNSDNVGEHTVPEGLETGEYICDDIIYNSALDSFKYVLRVTEYTPGSVNVPYITNFGGVIEPGGAYILDSAYELANVIQSYAGAGKSDAIIGCYMCPSVLILNESQDARYSGQTTPAYASQNISKPTSLNGYTPVNKKLLTFPFCFINVSNNNGSSNSLQYELFNEIDEYPGQCIFNIKGVPVLGGSIKCSPFNYKNSSEKDNEDEGLIAGKFPALGWFKDEYTNWLTQNAVNIGVGLSSNILTIIGGGLTAATGAGAIPGVSAIVSGGMGIARTLGQIYEHSLTPNSAKGNINGGDINVSSSKNGFFFYKMSIKREYAKIIDDFLSAYGYKVNSYKTPNITGRSNWNFVKTQEANLAGDIPQNDLQEIKDILNNGVTFWHNFNTFLDYSQSNSIV